MIYSNHNYYRATMANIDINNLKNDLFIYCSIYSRPEHSSDVSGALRSFTYMDAIMSYNLRNFLKESLCVEYDCMDYQTAFSDEYDAHVLADFIGVIKKICDEL